MNMGVLPILPLWLFSCHFNTVQTDTTPTPGTKGMCIICKVMMSPHLCCSPEEKEDTGRGTFFSTPLFYLQYMKLVCMSCLPLLQMCDWGNGISKNEGSDTRKRCDSVTPNKKNEHLLLCCLWLILNLRHFVKNPIHSVPIWPLPQRFPVIVFPRFQKQNTKGTNFDKFDPLHPPLFTEHSCTVQTHAFPFECS